MKKYLLSTVAAVGIVACATGAMASDSAQPTYGPYLVGEVGMGIGVSDNDDSGLMAIGAGYRANEYMRADMTVGYRPWGKVHFKGSNQSKSDTWSIPVMANAYLTYPIYQSMSIYGMGGLGMAWNNTDDITGASGRTRMSLAWTAGGGISYALNSCWDLDLGYRYTDLGDAKVKAQDGYDGKVKQAVRSNDIKLSARYYF